MSKQTGIISNLYLDDADLSGDVGAVDSIAQSRAQLDVTAINKDHMERLPGVSDGSMQFTSYFNTAGAHAELSAMATAAKIATVSLGTAVGDAAASCVAAEVSYNVNRGQDGSLVTQANVLPDINGGGIEWGSLLTGKATLTPGTASASVDGGAASSTGAAAYLHVFSVTAGTVTVSVVDSADDSSFAAVSGLSFTATAAGTAERVETAGTATLRRYARWVMSGGTAVVAVNLIRGL